MSRKDEDKMMTETGESSGLLSVLDSNSSGAAGNAQLPPFAASALQSLSGNQLSFLDPNVMMMTNAAATIAAVAASAVQQLNQSGAGSAASSVNGNRGGISALTPALLAQLRSSAASQSISSSSLQPQLVALLAAAGGGSRHGLQLQNTTGPPLSASLQQILSQVEAAKAHPPPAPSSITSGVTITAMPTGMQGWTLAQLEKHTSLLRQMNQPIPQSVALLLADAQRKEKKKTAKRAANRKSASTSRARKKALVEEMTRTNARLKRQALILSLLPDLVLATSLEGEITFCSAQVERILGHKAEDLVGVELDKLLVPSSRDILQKLFKRLLNPGKSRSSRQAQGRRGTKRRQGEKDAGEATNSKNDVQGKEGGNVAGRGSSQSGDGNSGNTGTTNSAANIISEQSFPLSVVEVESKRAGSRRKDAPDNVKSREDQANSNENSDNSTSNISGSNNSASKQQVSSLSNGTGLSGSPVESPSEEDDGAQGDSKGSKRAKTEKTDKQQSSDDSSSLSSEAKNMRTANDNLDRNVRWHNQRMMGESQKTASESGPKDDVTGASVTANNASARLSSLKHVPSPTKKIEKPPSRYENDQLSSDDSMLAGVEEKKKVGNTSDDSGYRESNDSREETSSSGSDSSNAKERRTPVAPTCRLLLIRSDLTTIWCEVTSSMRDRAVEEDALDLEYATLKSADGSVQEEPIKKKPVHEFLLCFRPMRDGDKKADESLRLVAARLASEEDSPVNAMVSSSGNDSNSHDKGCSEKTSGDASGSNSTSSVDKGSPKRPPKKRHLDEGSKLKDVGKKPKKAKKGEGEVMETEQSVVESLMLMNKSQQ